MKTALITGIGKGIGKALAEKFLKEGFFVIGTYHTAKPEFENSNLVSFQLDLTDSRSIDACVAEVSKLGKKIDLLINNAGVLLDVDDTAVTIEKLRGTLEVNLIGTIALTERIIPLLADDAHVINISSSAGSLNLSPEHDHYPHHYPAYKISKTALNMYTRTLAGRFESEKINITVSSLHPGWVRTEMGGEEAPMLPEEVAEDVYELALAHPETGQFWHKGEKFPW